MTTCKLDGHILPVQISANIILVLSETSVIFSEAETCSNLEGRKKKTKKPNTSSMFQKHQVKMTF